MAEIIRKLQQKPAEARRHISFFAAGFITLVIVAFWISSLSLDFSREESLAARSEMKKETSTPSPFLLLFKQFRRMADDIR